MTSKWSMPFHPVPLSWAGLGLVPSEMGTDGDNHRRTIPLSPPVLVGAPRAAVGETDCGRQRGRRDKKDAIRGGRGIRKERGMGGRQGESERGERGGGYPTQEMSVVTHPNTYSYAAHTPCFTHLRSCRVELFRVAFGELSRSYGVVVVGSSNNKLIDKSKTEGGKTRGWGSVVLCRNPSTRSR